MKRPSAHNARLQAWIRGQRAHRSDAAVLAAAGLNKNYLNQPLSRTPHPMHLRKVANAAKGDYLDLCIYLGVVILEDLQPAGCRRTRGSSGAGSSLSGGSPEKLRSYLRRRLREVGTSMSAASKGLERSRGALSAPLTKGPHPDILRKLAPICDVPYLILMLVAGYLNEEDLLKQGWCLPDSLLVIELEPSRFSAAFSEPELGLEGVTEEPSVPASTSGDAPKRRRPSQRARPDQLALFDPAA